MNALWVLSRATGLVSLVLLTLVVVLGIVVRRRGLSSLPRFVAVGLHRNASLLAVALVAVHIATVVADSYVPIRWWDALVPFVGSYRSFWLGLGTVTVDLVAAILVTSLLRHRLPGRVWRSVHWLAYLCWPVALAHGVGIGTDMRSAPGLALASCCAVAGAGAALWRMSAPAPVPPQDRAAAMLTDLRLEQSRRPTLTGGPR